jgi:glycosyltransferase involved in cell wall biosynthesis
MSTRMQPTDTDVQSVRTTSEQSTVRIGAGKTDFSILVCTRNRNRQLERLLRSISRLKIPPRRTWELVIVDNASTDGTDKVIQKFAGHLPIIAVREPRPGISHARNAARMTARGRWLFSTDDDVTVPEDWFVKYAEAAERYPSAAFFGGTIDAVFPSAHRGWKMSARLAARSAFAIFKVDKHDERLTAQSPGHRLPFGANYAFRANVLKAFAFRADLGRQPGGNHVGRRRNCNTR